MAGAHGEMGLDSVLNIGLSASHLYAYVLYIARGSLQLVGMFGRVAVSTSHPVFKLEVA